MFHAMRFTAILAAIALLSACAAASPLPAPNSVAPAPMGERAALLARAGRADAPTEAEIARAFGAPDITRRDGVGAALTYRFETCALLMLFSADARNAMRLREAHASARRVGDAAPSQQQCAGEPRGQ